MTGTEDIDLKKRQCLIVEDHAGLRERLVEWLGASFPDCEMLEAATGEAGVRMALNRLPAVVLMDVSLPGISGIEATRAIKAARPGLPVVMLTVHENSDYHDDALDAGADAYILKRRAHTDLIPVLARHCSPGSRGADGSKQAQGRSK